MILHIISLIFLIPSVLIISYYLFFILIAFFSKTRFTFVNDTDISTFAIIIPAHNEEKGIGRAIESVQKLDYPVSHYKTFVVADNCTDKTAEIANNYANIEVLERYNDKEKGKGFALEWALNQVLQNNYDAVLIIDADCELNPFALKVFNKHLVAGTEVLQANYRVSNPDASLTSYVLAIGNIIENQYFYSPRSRLGLPVLLRGTGMVFKTRVLKKFPWKAHSIVEDVEYGINLINNGIKIVFDEEVLVWSEFPENYRQLSIQRERWASGNYNLAKTNAIKLIRDGIKERNFKLAELGWSLFTLSRPIVILITSISFIISTLNLIVYGSSHSKVLFLINIIFLGILIVYFMLGIFELGLSAKRIKFILKSPVVLSRLIIISIKGLLRKNFIEWNRTPK